jgi:signal transduction histidine kinase
MVLRVEMTDEVGGCEILTDSRAVEQILYNLVDNAAKYARGSQHPEVTLGVEVAAGCLQLRVRDFGPGIAPALRQKLFKPFTRSSEEAAGNAPGVGLGLALSRRLSRALGGELSLDRSVTDGSCLLLKLPVHAGN